MDTILKEKIQSKEVVAIIDNNEKVENGAYVYREHDFLFDKYDSIAEAIRASVKEENAMVLCNGAVVNYAKADDENAYYILNDKVRLVKLDDKA